MGIYTNPQVLKNSKKYPLNRTVGSVAPSHPPTYRSSFNNKNKNLNGNCRRSTPAFAPSSPYMSFTRYEPHTTTLDHPIYLCSLRKFKSSYMELLDQSVWVDILMMVGMNVSLAEPLSVSSFLSQLQHQYSWLWSLFLIPILEDREKRLCRLMLDSHFIQVVSILDDTLMMMNL